MAVTSAHHRKAPSQNPVAFYQGKQQGGSHGKPTSVPRKIQGGPMREKVYGTKAKE